jgi:hypothetical protein
VRLCLAISILQRKMLYFWRALKLSIFEALFGRSSILVRSSILAIYFVTLIFVRALNETLFCETLFWQTLFCEMFKQKLYF